MDNKKYLKWYNKIGYGSGDIAGNIVYAFLATFVMIYLTDTAGLNAGIVGTLMMVSIFAVPLEWGDVAKYAYFFITYTLLNGVFFTANNMTYILGDADLLGTFSFAINIPMMLIFTGVAAIAMSPMQGDLNALIAACSDYTYRTTGKRRLG